jgi:Tol biopolymer transport system component
VAAAGIATGSAAGVAGQSWARGSNRIVFQSDRDGPVDIYAINADGSRMQRLTKGSKKAVGTKSEEEALVPRWSPDKREIAYTRVKGASASLVIVSSQGRRIRQFPNNTAFAAWSHDGTKLALACGKSASLCTTDASGGSARSLVDVGSTLSPPTWSPDDKLIVASGYRSPEPQLFNDRPDLFRVPVRQPRSKDDYDGIAVGGEPDWSPDATKIVFAATWDRKSGRHERNPEIYVMRVNSRGKPIGEPVRLTNHPGLDAFPAWSSDGRRIAFARQSGDKSVDIYVMNSDGSGLEQLTHDHAFDVAPDW